MTKTEESGPNEEPAAENSSRDHGSWKRVDPKIWSRRERRSGLSAKISSIPTWLGWALTSTVFFVFVLAPLGGLSAYLTILIAFYFGGLRFFGFYFIGIWAAIIVGFVVIVKDRLFEELRVMGLPAETSSIRAGRLCDRNGSIPIDDVP